MQQATLMTSERNSWQLYVKLHFPLTGGIDLHFYSRIHQALHVSTVKEIPTATTK